MYLEKALENQRHIEVQVFSDIFGKCVPLGVRDCTTQRKRQKFIEETGDLGVPVALTQELQSLCASVARAIGYVGAGTFEFLYDPESQKFTFMEMNTRIQVEHTITERLVQEAYDAKINLVELQFILASGQSHRIMDDAEKLQKNLEKHGGHAMEIRICAEDPTRNFTGKEMAAITSWSMALPRPLKKITRFETFLTRTGKGKNHTSKYDSMIGQLIVSGKNRAETIQNAIAALTALQIEGIPTNKEIALRILKSADFQEFGLRIDTLDKKPAQYFEGLTPFTGKVEYISAIKEDIVILAPGELVIRTNQATKVSRAPEAGMTVEGEIMLDCDGKLASRIFELVLAKNNTQITPEMLRGETFYLKNGSGESVPFEPDTRYAVTRSLVTPNQQIGRGQAVFVIRPTDEMV
jgi:acetyl/propionyl-CoA carboxylase alpha subunit